MFGCLNRSDDAWSGPLILGMNGHREWDEQSIKWINIIDIETSFSSINLIFGLFAFRRSTVCRHRDENSQRHYKVQQMLHFYCPYDNKKHKDRFNKDLQRFPHLRRIIKLALFHSEVKLLSSNHCISSLYILLILCFVNILFMLITNVLRSFLMLTINNNLISQIRL